MNPKYKTVHGLATATSVRDLEPGVDLAIIGGQTGIAVTGINFTPSKKKGQVCP